MVLYHSIKFYINEIFDGLQKTLAALCGQRNGLGERAQRSSIFGTGVGYCKGNSCKALQVKDDLHWIKKDKKSSGHYELPCHLSWMYIALEEVAAFRCRRVDIYMSSMLVPLWHCR